ncbi:polymeric immunoglobulin receptor-like [Morus bassanus]
MAVELRVLLLLPLCFPGLHAQPAYAVETLSEGSTLSIQCPYTAQDNYLQLKAWCRLRDDTCDLLVQIHTSRPYQYMTRAKKGRVTIEDYPMNSTVSVTMVNLQVEDSGKYSCAYRQPSRSYIPLKIIVLIVFKEFYMCELDSLSVQCPYSTLGFGTKTWCRTEDWTECKVVARTDYPATRQSGKALEGRTLIWDDTRQRTVTITMQKLQAQDTGMYWCALARGPHFTPITGVKLSVSKRVQQHTAKESGNVSVQCQYSAHHYGAVNKAWCKEGAQEACTAMVNTISKPSGYLRAPRQGRVTIQDDTQQGTVTITMEEVQAQDSGVYWCALYEHSHLFRMAEVTLNISKGTRQAEDIYDKPDDIAQLDSTERMESPKDDSKDLKYVTLNFQSRLSPEDPLYCNVEPNQTHRKPEDENVEYAIIALKQLPTNDKG